MSLANIDLNQYSIVRHRDTDKVYTCTKPLNTRLSKRQRSIKNWDVMR
ncbi:hypothetical protein [Adhaeribacter pallidiroseus]|nr:hypothetical protein [Adhaeribacter pallidiroseus]